MRGRSKNSLPNCQLLQSAGGIDAAVSSNDYDELALGRAIRRASSPLSALHRAAAVATALARSTFIHGMTAGGGISWADRRVGA